MKLQFIVFSVITSLIVVPLASCSSSEDLLACNPSITQLTSSGCLITNSGLNDRLDDEGADKLFCNTTFEMRITRNDAECSFKSLEYPCDFEKVNVEVFFEDKTLTIIEYPSSDMADCRCKVDANFNIKNIPSDSFELKIYHGNTNGEYNKNLPKLLEVVHVMNGSVIFPYGNE